MFTILPELEENQDPPFKLFIHTRDFDPGLRIFDNIEKAIVSSNAAILVMSQAFVNSIWCKEEFERCYIENMNDPAFKLFVIMMQPADTLQNLTESMKSFFAQRTYLEEDDPSLFQKIAQNLTEVKKPEVGDDEIGNNDVDNNENEANNVINVNNANILEYHTHSIDIDENINYDANNAENVNNDLGHRNFGYYTDIKLADVGTV